jgi:hypothetical protein
VRDYSDIIGGCGTCGGYGMHHDPIAHDWARESHPAPWPTPDEQRRIDEFGIFDEEEGR